MGLTFAQPELLLLVLLAIPVAWTGLRWLHGMSVARRWTAVAARAALLLLLAMILAGASAVRETQRLAVVAVVDVSESVRTFGDAFGEFGTDADGNDLSWAEAVRAWLEGVDKDRTDEDLLGVVVFDGSAIAVATPRPVTIGERGIDYQMTDGSDIAGALEFAEALFPPDAARRVVLISDGNETRGDAAATARELAASTGAQIDVVPITYRVRNEVMIERVDAPPRAQKESAAVVRVVLRSTHATTGTLDLVYNDRAIDINGRDPGMSRRVALREGRTVIPVEVPLSDRKLHAFTPIFTPDDPTDDGIVANNRAEAFTVSPGEGSVLLVDGRGDADRSALVRVLRDAGSRVDIKSPTDLSTNLLQLQQHELIILDNVGRPDVNEIVQRNLVDYVQTLGGGLIMVGGDDSFGAGLWNGSPLEPILPVILDLPEQIITPSAAIAFVLDSSGSMSRNVLGGARTQQEIANEAAALAITTLDTTDLVMVVSFNSTFQIVQPIARNTEPDVTAQRVRSITPGGGTNMYPAIDAAASALRQADANIKHMIVLTDGMSAGATAQRNLQLGQQLADEGITVSTIAVGDAADQDALPVLATASGGVPYQVIDPETLPRIFLKEIRVIRQPLIRQGRVDPVVLRTGSPVIAGLDTRSMPPLRGLVLSQQRDDPLVTTAMVTGEDEPLLAHWFVGRGQVAAFTSDAEAEGWARDWVQGWPGFGRLWTQLTRTIARSSEDTGYELTTEVEGDELIVRVDAFDQQGDPIDLLTIPGTLYLPDNSTRDIRLNQVGPGVYETRTDAQLQGNYVVTLQPMRGGRSLAGLTGGASRAVGPELARLRSNIGTLQAIADASGGRLLSLASPDARELFDRRDLEPTRAATPLWPLLTAWALFVFALDVGTRRIAWDRLLTRELVAEVRESAASAVRSRSGQVAATVGQLKTTGSARQQPKPDPNQPRERAPLRFRPTTATSSEQQAAGASTEQLAKARREAAERDERRRAMRAKMLDQLKGPGRDGAPDKRPDQPPSKPEEKSEEKDTMSGLLAAKRRARGNDE